MPGIIRDDLRDKTKEAHCRQTRGYVDNSELETFRVSLGGSKHKLDVM